MRTQKARFFYARILFAKNVEKSIVILISLCYNDFVNCFSAKKTETFVYPNNRRTSVYNTKKGKKSNEEQTRPQNRQRFVF